MNNVKNFANWLLISTVSTIIPLIPFRLVPSFSIILGGLAFYVFPSRKAIATKNAETCFPSKSRAKRIDIIFRSYQHLIKNVIFLLKMPSIYKELESCTDFQTPKQLLEDSKNGIILVTAHLGMWEMLPFLASKYLESEISIVYRDLTEKNANKLLTKIRTSAGSRVHYIKDSESDLLKKLETELNLGHSIGLVADQRPRKNFFKVKFFGREINTFGGFSVLHERTKKPVWFVTLLEDGKHSWKLESHRLDSSDRISEIELLQKYYDLLQNLIESHPSQYYWIHNRFLG